MKYIDCSRADLKLDYRINLEAAADKKWILKVFGSICRMKCDLSSYCFQVGQITEFAP